MKLLITVLAFIYGCTAYATWDPNSLNKIAEQIVAGYKKHNVQVNKIVLQAPSKSAPLGFIRTHYNSNLQATVYTKNGGSPQVMNVPIQFKLTPHDVATARNNNITYTWKP